MKILHTSDWHVGRRIRGRDRSEEHRAVLGELVALAEQHSVDLTLVAGDVFDTASPTPTSEGIVWRALLDLAETSPVLVVAGNHDNPARHASRNDYVAGDDGDVAVDGLGGRDHEVAFRASRRRRVEDLLHLVDDVARHRAQVPDFDRRS